MADFRFNTRAKKYLNEIIGSNRLTYGPFTRKFESKFAKIHRRPWAVFTSSGTGALQAGLAAMKEYYGWKDGDEILVPAISFITTANVVYNLRLKPVFVDVDPITFNLDASQISKHVTKKTRAIIPVHVLGLPADMPAIKKQAIKHNLRILEDSCDTMFVGIKDRPVGSFGDLAAFSTYVAHLLPTGVGGFLIGSNKRLEELARSYIFHGRHQSYLSIDDDDKKGLEKALKNRFRFDWIGSHFRLTEMEAAIGLSQLETNLYLKQLKHRQLLAKSLIKKLKPLSDRLQLPVTPAGYQHSYMMFTFLIKDKSINKWKLLKYLEEKGIETRELLPLLNQPAYKKVFGNIENRYPTAKMVNQFGFYIGCHPNMNLGDISFIAESLNEFLSK